MENQISTVESLFENAGKYIETNVNLLKLKAVDRSANAFSAIFYKLIIMLVVFSVVIFIGVGLALWLGELFGKTYYGFFTVAGLFIITGILLYAFRKELLKQSFSNLFVKEILN